MFVIESLFILICGLFVGWISVMMFHLTRDAMNLYNKKGGK